MRISDWSSDVCSSDLPDRLAIPYIHIHQVAPEHLVRDCEVECFVDMQDWITKCRSPHNKGRQQKQKHNSDILEFRPISYGGKKQSLVSADNNTSIGGKREGFRYFCFQNPDFSVELKR